jgi:polyhydroxyalkanoate synthase
LINQAYILDLMPGVSLLDELTARGFRSFLLDWGRPTSVSKRLSLSGWIRDYLEPAFDRVKTLTSLPPFVLGYCMGGTLGTALACLRPNDIAGLILLATPWDFESYKESSNPLSDHHALTLSAGSLGAVPVDSLQMYFANIAPLSIPKKFSEFGQTDPHSQVATQFVAIEDWLNDGEPLGAEVAAECFLGWLESNKPALGLWEIDGKRIRPANLDLPAFLAVPENDVIVPPQSALALTSALRDTKVIHPRSGHVGMVVGQKAKHELWNPMIAWLERVSAMHRNIR